MLKSWRRDVYFRAINYSLTQARHKDMCLSRNIYTHRICKFSTFLTSEANCNWNLIVDGSIFSFRLAESNNSSSFMDSTVTVVAWMAEIKVYFRIGICCCAWPMVENTLYINRKIATWSFNYEGFPWKSHNTCFYGQCAYGLIMSFQSF